MAARHLDAGTLQIVLPEWSARVWPVYAVYPATRQLGAKVRVFIDWAVELFELMAKGPSGHEAVPSVELTRAAAVVPKASQPRARAEMHRGRG